MNTDEGRIPSEIAVPMTIVVIAIVAITVWILKTPVPEYPEGGTVSGYQAPADFTLQ